MGSLLNIFLSTMLTNFFSLLSIDSSLISLFLTHVCAGGYVWRQHQLEERNKKFLFFSSKMCYSIQKNLFFGTKKTPKK